MTKKLFLILLLITSFTTYGQKRNSTKNSASAAVEIINVPLKAEYWEFKQGSVEFLDYKSVPAIKVLNSEDFLVLKNFAFKDGTIEYDIEPLDPTFCSFYFRVKSKLENECFYFRTKRAGDSTAIDAIQYAPFVDGVNLWDMLFHFQTKANVKKDNWNHVKLVISGKQMRAYVNDMNTPALEVPHLEGNVSSGTLAFDGKGIISNLVIKHNSVELLSPKEGLDPTITDQRYIKNWYVSTPTTTEKNIDFSYDYYPNETTKWENISIERQGLVNLSRKFGKAESRRIVWLKTTIHSSKVQEKNIALGFSDEVWVFINNQPLYMDKNLYNTPMMKPPYGRCSVENTSFNLPLNEGKNELLIGVANNFYGWGIIARLENMEGITIVYK